MKMFKQSFIENNNDDDGANLQVGFLTFHENCFK
jgi:hypothetical protein